MLDDNKDWIESWLWYTGGEIRLNPFPYADHSKMLERTDWEIKEIESELALISRQEISQNKEGRTDRMTFLLARLQMLKQAREDLTKVDEEYKKWLAKISISNEVLYSGVWHGSTPKEIKWLHHYDASRDFRFLNDKKSIPNMVTEQDQVSVYVHNLKNADKISVSSALSVFQPKSELETTADALAAELTKAVGGSSTIQGLAQIIASLSSQSRTTDQGSVSKASLIMPNISKVWEGSPLDDYDFGSIKPEDLKAFVLTEIKPGPFTYAQLKTNPAIIQSLYNKINAAKGRAAGKPRQEKLVEELQDVVNTLRNTTKANAVALLFGVFDIKDQTAYEELINEYLYSKENLIWLSSQTIPIRSLTLKADENPIFRTHTEFPESKVAIETSNKLAYTLMLNEKTTVARHTYIKYFTSKFMPSFSLGYVFGQRSALRFDETSGQFKAQEKDFDNIEALVGVKWYPGKNNPARKFKTTKIIGTSLDWKANRARGNNFLNTLYLSGGLGVSRKLLRNYYVGAGFDIIPGVSLQGGLNFIFQKQYELENAKIKNETEVLKPFGYVGLGLDLGIVTNLIRILIP